MKAVTQEVNVCTHTVNKFTAYVTCVNTNALYTISDLYCTYAYTYHSHFSPISLIFESHLHTPLSCPVHRIHAYIDVHVHTRNTQKKVVKTSDVMTCTVHIKKVNRSVGTGR